MNELEFKLALSQKLCDLVDVILHYYNPCELVGAECIVTRAGLSSCCCKGQWDRNPGDRTCVFSVDERCNFRNVDCKLFMCATVIERSPDCVRDLKDIELIAKRYGLTRKPYIGDGYVGRRAEIEKMRSLKNG